LSVLPVRSMGDPVLREKARPVEHFDAALKRLVADMGETMYERNGVGLAAPQVGVSSRLFVFDDGDTGPLMLANPEFLDSEGEDERDEGCLSLPGIYFALKRAQRAKIRGVDLDGRPLEFEGEGLLARIFQHEMDHIDGVLFVDRLSEANRREAMRLLREQDLGSSVRGTRPSDEL